MPDTDGDLPNAMSDEVPATAAATAAADGDTVQTESRPTIRLIPLSTLWWNLLWSAIVAPLAFVVFALALVWDQWPWMAIVALPIGICAAVYATWCLMMLQRYYLEQRRAATQQPM
jgi:hypothetical protein